MNKPECKRCKGTKYIDNPDERAEGFVEMLKKIGKIERSDAIKFIKLKDILVARKQHENIKYVKDCQDCDGRGFKKCEV